MVCTKMPAYFIATAHSMIIDILDSRGVFGSANNATCILRRGFCTSVLFIRDVVISMRLETVSMQIMFGVVCEGKSYASSVCDGCIFCSSSSR